MKTYVLVNEKSNNSAGGTDARELKNVWSDRELEFRDITAIGDYKAFFEEIGSADVVICGGDGTLNHFVNDIDGISFDNNVYYFATGTGNDFRNDIVRKDKSNPCLINKYIRDLPTVTVKGMKRKFINGIGYGIDGYCCEVGDKLRETSDKPINYTSIAIKGLLFHYKPTNAIVTVDGVKHSFKKVWLAPTMKGSFYGGGMMPAPDQNRLSPDKTVSVMVMYGKGKLGTLIAFPTIFKGEHVKKTKIVSVMKGKKIKVEFDRPVALQIDGETVLGVTEYTVEV